MPLLTIAMEEKVQYNSKVGEGLKSEVQLLFPTSVSCPHCTAGVVAMQRDTAPWGSFRLVGGSRGCRKM